MERYPGRKKNIGKVSGMANVKWQRPVYFSVLMIVLACVSTAPAISQSSELEQADMEQPTDLLSDENVPLDVRIYSEDMGVPLQEATRRMNLQERFTDDLANLEAELRKEESDTFAGLWIQHEPEYRFVVAFTEDGDQTIQPYLEGESFSENLEVRSGAKATLKKLETDQARSWNLVRLLGLKAETLIDVTTNRVYLRVLNADSFNGVIQRAGQSLPNNVAVVEVENFLASQASIYAGLKLTPPNGIYCTSGFSVVHTPTGRAGITTAGHCADANDNVIYFGNRYLPWQNGSQSSHYDLQWHATPDLNDKPWARYPDADGYRTIIAARGRYEQDIGTFVCHFGQGGTESEYKCGTIQSRNFGRVEGDNVEPTRIYVTNNNTDLSDAGDSGGPWYTQNGQIALGIHEAGDSNEAAYMSITYFNDDGPIDFNLVVKKG